MEHLRARFETTAVRTPTPIHPPPMHTRPGAVRGPHGQPGARGHQLVHLPHAQQRQAGRERRWQRRGGVHATHRRGVRGQREGGGGGRTPARHYVDNTKYAAWRGTFHFSGSGGIEGGLNLRLQWVFFAAQHQAKCLHTAKLSCESNFRQIAAACQQLSCKFHPIIGVDPCQSWLLAPVPDLGPYSTCNRGLAR